MKYLYPIIILLFLLLSCTEEKEEPSCIESVPYHTLLPKLQRPLIDTMNDFMEISDTVLIEEKSFKYSIFLPKTFDTVFKQSYGCCTYSTMRTLFANQAYSIEPQISTFLHKREKDDSLFYIAIAHDTLSNQIINEKYRIKHVKSRRSAREAQRSSVEKDTSYLISRNKNTRMITECIHNEKYISFDLELLVNNVLFEVSAVYEGEHTMDMQEQLKFAIESFEAERID